MATTVGLATQLRVQVGERLLRRNQIVEEFFSRESMRLAEACRSMSSRFVRGGGRLLAFDKGLTQPTRSMSRSSLFIP